MDVISCTGEEQRDEERPQRSSYTCLLRDVQAA